MCLQRACVDHGIKVADVKSFFEDTPTENVSQSLSSSPTFPTFRAALPPARLETSKSHRMETRATRRYRTYNKVLNTGELLEKIIFELPPSAIVRLRRVNKTWKHIIMTLPCIRKKIFLDAEPLTKRWVYDNHYGVLRPYTEGMEAMSDGQWGPRQSECAPSMLNPMLFRREDRAEPLPLHDRAKLCETVRFAARPDIHLDLSGAGSSIYHGMFVTQPPVEIVQYMLWFQDRNVKGSLFSCRLQIKRTGGVRLGHILDTFKHGYQMADPITGEIRHVDPMLDPITGAPRDLSLLVSDHTKKKTAIWMLGAIFVSDDEEAAVEKLRPQPKVEFSWQAQEQMRQNNNKILDFRPTAENFIDRPHRVRGDPVEVIDLTGDDSEYDFTDDEATDDEATDDEATDDDDSDYCED